MAAARPDSEGPATTVESYWSESRRPFASLLFTVPLLVAYEAGVLFLGRHAMRNGAEAWLRQLLDMLGFSQYFLLPILTICILLGWHYVTRKPWRLSGGGVLYGMIGESVLLALCLRFLLHLQNLLMQPFTRPLRMTIADTMGSVAGYLGAGVYEELMFRLILLSLAIGVLKWARLSGRASMIGGVVTTSLVFAIAHHLGPCGDEFNWFTLLFRFSAGAFFSVLFVYRGFGIAAGTHAGYDVLVGFSLGS
jgi:hypothetical protein